MKPHVVYNKAALKRPSMEGMDFLQAFEFTRTLRGIGMEVGPFCFYYHSPISGIRGQVIYIPSLDRFITPEEWVVIEQVLATTGKFEGRNNG